MDTTWTHYAVAVGDSPAELKDAVQDMMGTGWQPFGSLAVSAVTYRDDDNFIQVDERWAQAMVK